MADHPQYFSVDREHSSDFNEQAALDEDLNIPPPSYQQALDIGVHGDQLRSPSFLSPPQQYSRAPSYTSSIGSLHNVSPTIANRDLSAVLQNHIPTIVVHSNSSNYCQALPTYHPRVDPNSPPPDYNTLFGRVKPYRNNNTEHGPDILQTCSKILCSGTIGKVLGTSLIVLLIGVLVFMIAIGSLYRLDCPAQDTLPLYLIVSGAVPLVWAVRCFSYQPCVCIDRPEDERRRRARQRKFEGMAIVDAGIFCFIFAWFVIGGYWVYGMWSWSPDSSAANYCHPMVYYLVFWSITTVYILGGCVGGVVIIVVLGIYCCHFWTEYIKPGFCDTTNTGRVAEL